MSFHNKMMRAFAVAFAVLIVITAAACNKIPASTKEESATVLTIDEFAVPYEQLRYFVRNYLNEHGDAETWKEGEADTIRETVLADALDALREQYAILSLAKQYGIDRNDKAIKELVDGQIDAAIADYGDTEAYVEALAASHMTASVHRFLLTVSACNEELYYAMMKAGELTADEADVKAAVYSDEFIRVKQVLIANDPGENEEANRELAEEVLALARAGEDFDDLVAEYGEDLFMFNNTDGYYMCRGVWYKEFENAAFSLEIGEISDVVLSEAGYSIILRCEKEDTYLDAHLDFLGTDLRDAQLSLAIEAKAAEMTLTTNDTFASYDILTLE